MTRGEAVLISGGNHRRLHLRATRYANLPKNLGRAMAWLEFPWIEDEEVTEEFRDRLVDLLSSKPDATEPDRDHLAFAKRLLRCCEDHDVPVMMQTAKDVVLLLQNEVGKTAAHGPESEAEAEAEATSADPFRDETSWWDFGAEAAEFIASGLDRLGVDDQIGLISVGRVAPGAPDHLERAFFARNPLAQLLSVHALGTRDASRSALHILSDELRDLADRLGLTAALSEVPLASIVQRGFVERHRVDAEELRTTLAEHSTYSDIAADRLFCAPDRQSTLDELGTRHGLTRERIRQLEKKLQGRLNRLSVIEDCRRVAPLLHLLAGERTTAEALEREAKSLFSGQDEPLQTILAWATILTSHYVIEGADARLPAVDQRLSQAAMIIEDGARRAIVPADVIAEALAMCSEADLLDLGLAPFVEGAWLRRDSQRARIIGGLEVIGRPASKDEIAAHAGVPPQRVSSVLSTVDDVARADVNLWGFREHVSEEYHGISEAIALRIGQAGGRARAGDVKAEILERFSVAPSSVDAYLKSHEFVVEGGFVRLAEDSDLELSGAAWEVDGAVQTDHGWGQTLTVTDKHFDGYSFIVHPKVVRANGLNMDESLRVPVEGTDAQASLIWRRRALNGAEVGRVRDPLVQLGFEEGDEVVVVPTPQRVWILARVE